MVQSFHLSVAVSVRSIREVTATNIHSAQSIFTPWNISFACNINQDYTTLFTVVSPYKTLLCLSTQMVDVDPCCISEGPTKPGE